MELRDTTTEDALGSRCSPPPESDLGARVFWGSPGTLERLPPSAAYTSELSLVLPCSISSPPTGKSRGALTLEITELCFFARAFTGWSSQVRNPPYEALPCSRTGSQSLPASRRQAARQRHAG